MKPIGVITLSTIFAAVASELLVIGPKTRDISKNETFYVYLNNDIPKRISVEIWVEHVYVNDMWDYNGFQIENVVLHRGIMNPFLLRRYSPDEKYGPEINLTLSIFGSDFPLAGIFHIPSSHLDIDNKKEIVIHHPQKLGFMDSLRSLDNGNIHPSRLARMKQIHDEEVQNPLFVPVEKPGEALLLEKLKLPEYKFNNEKNRPHNEEVHVDVDASKLLRAFPKA